MGIEFMLNRREMLHAAAIGTGAAFGLSALPGRLLASATAGGAPKRIIFFLQNQGFDPAT